MRIEKKIWPQFFDKVESGEKKFELRLGDFHCEAGDTLILREWDPEEKQYTGRTMEKKITYVSRTKEQPFWTEEQVTEFGFQVLQLE